MREGRLGIIGASGAVGEEVLRCLKELSIPLSELRLAGSKRSIGMSMDTPYGKRDMQELNEMFFRGLDYVIFAVGGEVSEEFVPIALSLGLRVIDNSSFYRYDRHVPLVVPAINAQSIGNAQLIANPNCTTAIAVMALYPIYKKYGIKKLLISTYQAASGAGKSGMEELIQNTERSLDKKENMPHVFQHDLAFNLIPHIDRALENGYTQEEMKVVWEIQKIFHDPTIDISCTAVRVPVLRAHSESITLETREKVDIADIRKLLITSPGIRLKDDINNNLYPMPKNASHSFDVEVGRVRKSLVFGDYGIEMFISGDQLLRGAALNAVEILRECTR